MRRFRFRGPRPSRHLPPLPRQRRSLPLPLRHHLPHPHHHLVFRLALERVKRFLAPVSLRIGLPCLVSDIVPTYCLACDLLAAFQLGVMVFPKASDRNGHSSADVYVSPPVPSFLLLERSLSSSLSHDPVSWSEVVSHLVTTFNQYVRNHIYDAHPDCWVSVPVRNRGIRCFRFARNREVEGHACLGLTQPLPPLIVCLFVTPAAPLSERGSCELGPRICSHCPLSRRGSSGRSYHISLPCSLLELSALRWCTLFFRSPRHGVHRSDGACCSVQSS